MSTRKTLSILTLSLSITQPCPAADEIFTTFEGDGFGTWSTQGLAFGKAPAAGGIGELKSLVDGFSQNGFASSYHPDGTSTGSLTSPEFKLSKNYIHFLVAGAKDGKAAAIQLIVDGQVLRSTPGEGSAKFIAQVWDVRDLKDKKAQIKIIDSSEQKDGYIMVDHIVFSDSPAYPFPATHSDILVTNEMVPSTDFPNLEIPANSKLEVIADHDSHGLTSPTAICPTESGDWLVTETWRFMNEQGIDDNRHRRYWILEDIASQTTADRMAMYKRWYHKHPVEHYTKNAEKIRRIFDSNNDGTLDSNNIYADGFNHPLDGTAAGIFQYRDTTYFACIPHIWALKDEDKDGVAEKRESLQEGFGVRVSFSGHDLNGFALGPDGRIYGTIGDRGFNLKTKEGKHYVYPGQGAVIRFEPDGSNMEVVHTGLRNPKEIAFDQYGNAITVDNNSDQGDLARIVYVMDGGDSGWRMGHQVLHSFHRTAGLENRPINRWMQEKMWQPENDSQPLSILPPILNLTNGPSGLTFDPGTGAHPDFQNHFLVCDYRGSAAYSEILGFAIEPDGAGMKVTSAKKFNRGAAVTDVEYGYDGKVYVSDFVGGWSTHAAGRLYTITADKPVNADHIAEVSSLIKQGIHKLPSERLVSLLEHPDLRLRTRAHICLAERKEIQLLADSLAKFEKEEKIIPALHATWGLGIIARKHADAQYSAGGPLISLAMHSKHAELKAQALRCLGDIPHTIEKQGLVLRENLQDNSPRVRLFAAIGLTKHKDPDAHIRLRFMLKNMEDVDPYLLNASALALKNNSTAEQLAELSSHDSVNVRLAAVLALRHLHHPSLSRFLKDSDQRIHYAAIRAIFDQELTELMPALCELLPVSADNQNGSPHALTPMMQRRLIHAAYRVGGKENIQRLITFASDANSDQNQRIEAIRLLDEWAKPFPVNQALGKYAPLPERSTEELIALLTKAIPKLVELEDFIVAPSLHLLNRYSITDSSITAQKLASIATNQDYSPSVRGSALSVLATQDKSTLIRIAPELAESDIEELAAQALSSLSDAAPSKAVPYLIKACEYKSPLVQQTAWTLLGKSKSAAAKEKIIQGAKALSAKEISPATLEIMEAAKAINDPQTNEALANYVSELEQSPLDKYRSALLGGHGGNGANIYYSHGSAQCMRCHKIGYGHVSGGNAGPNLAGVANRRSREDLLAALVLPSAQLASGYGSVSLKFKNGKSVSATLIDQDDQSLTVQLGELVHRIKKNELDSFSTSPSAMPPMGETLTMREIRDLLEYISTLTDETGKPKSLPPVISPLDIDKLPTPKQEDLGKRTYLASCSACHQDDGKGIVGAFPPLAESEWVNGPAENLIRIQLRGLQGPITVKGVEYNNVMPAQAQQSDEEIAAVLTYIRSNFGNKAPAVTPDQVKALRHEAKKPLLKAEDLKKPKE
ncbi:quinoprotein glucose dehydrogenase [Rubritalea squalenifaciens DSM 18772]|uniref:Quinoprotein glucose dehydrogenase n=1 Tax=Rubritalea squalenifaciens DSM 18772 TaxID=1123071 RepID=A0A1M6HM08_9BACT|nr:c-type cytochrome [Rubritalea squalenifaciens]SHJ23229.1 quinoprotein glucose dehydrogenase [Rubritalea squalenifaciens DSM 18772]